jgi:threonine dehydrogenase-like Zn-dependent dehydrogenase
MPRQLIAPGPEQVAISDYELPDLSPTQVRVRSHWGAAKHGTEMSLYKGYGGPRGAFDGELRVFQGGGGGVGYPAGLGNMSVGEVVEVGSEVGDLGVGDRVFAHGPFREEHLWEASRVRRLPDGVPWQAAVCLDPADFALGAVRDGHVRLGDAVAVFGLGAIGLMAVQLARLAGAHPVIGVDPVALRRQVARDTGADLVFDPTECDAGVEIKQATGRRGADVCIEYSGHHAALQQALRGVAYLGTVVAGAYPGPYPAGLDFGAEAHMNRPSIVFSRACSEPNPEHPGWDENRLFEVVWRLLSDGSLDCVPVVQPVVDFDDLLAEYPKIATAPGQNVKLGVRFPPAR